MKNQPQWNATKIIQLKQHSIINTELSVFKLTCFFITDCVMFNSR